MGRFRAAWRALTKGDDLSRVVVTPLAADFHRRPAMKISDVAYAESVAAFGTPLTPWTIPEPPPWAASAPKTVQLAMDSALANIPGSAVADIYRWAIQGSFAEGLGFLGYTYLAELSQRPEYRRVSEIFAAEATRKWIKLSGAAEPKLKKLEKALKKFKVRDLFRVCAEKDGFFGRVQLFIDLGHRPDDDELSKPLISKAKVEKGSLKGFKVIEPFWSYPGVYESTNPLDPDYYIPKYWYVMSSIVDSSRLLTMVGRPLPDMLKPAYMFGGVSLSQMVKPYVDNWLRTRQSVSDLVHSFSTMVLKTNMSAILSGGSNDSLIKRIGIFNKFRDNRGAMAIDKDSEELGNVSTPLGTLDKLLAQSQEQIASVSGIPLVVLLGVTPSGLNASSDGEIKTFYATINSYQERVFRDPLERVIELVQLNEFGHIDPEITFEFVELWEMDEKAKAEIRKSDADADVAYITAGVVDNEEVRDRIVNDENSSYFGAELKAEAPVVDLEPDATDDDDDPTEPGGSGKDDPPSKPAQDAAPVFHESDHPRAANGKFGSGGAGAASSRSVINEPEPNLPAGSSVRQPVASWEGFKEIGPEAHAQLTEALHSVAGTLGLGTSVSLPEDMPPDGKGGYLFIAPLKSEARAVAKVQHDYGGDWSQLRDYVRASIACDTVEEAMAAFHKATDADLPLAAQPKNRFDKPTVEGYRDLNTLVTLPNGMVAEIQFHVKPMILAKDEAHDYYAEQQKLCRKNGSDAPNDQWDERDAKLFAKVQAEQKRIYADAWANAGG